MACTTVSYFQKNTFDNLCFFWERKISDWNFTQACLPSRQGKQSLAASAASAPSPSVHGVREPPGALTQQGEETETRGWAAQQNSGGKWRNNGWKAFFSTHHNIGIWLSFYLTVYFSWQGQVYSPYWSVFPLPVFLLALVETEQKRKK